MDPKDWFSSCEECGARYETRFADNRLCQECNRPKIIIDEVNVSKCKSFQENYGEYWQGCWENNDICHEFKNHCSDNKNCQFKKGE